jgi:hypothetical protein
LTIPQAFVAVGFGVAHEQGLAVGTRVREAPQMRADTLQRVQQQPFRPGGLVRQGGGPAVLPRVLGRGVGWQAAAEGRAQKRDVDVDIFPSAHGVARRAYIGIPHRNVAHGEFVVQKHNRIVLGIVPNNFAGRGRTGGGIPWLAAETHGHAIGDTVAFHPQTIEMLRYGICHPVSGSGLRMPEDVDAK